MPNGVHLPEKNTAAVQDGFAQEALESALRNSDSQVLHPAMTTAFADSSAQVLTAPQMSS